MSKRFYVYVHKYASGPKQGQVFYVGKGSCRKRFKTTAGRNVYWKRVVNKYGFDYKIVKLFDREQCAFTFEKILIHSIGKEKLCNLTAGGEGASGREVSEETRQHMRMINKGIPPSKASLDAARERNSIPIGTRCGLRFSSITEAAKYVNPDNVKAAKTSISGCVNGRQKHSYGYEWGIVAGDNLVFKYKRKLSDRRPWKHKAIQTTCGKYFESITDAVSWLRNNGFERASTSALVRSCQRERSISYGYKWKYVDNDNKTKEAPGRLHK